MASLSSSLLQALSAREEARRLLASLDQLGAEGSLVSQHASAQLKVPMRADRIRHRG